MQPGCGGHALLDEAGRRVDAYTIKQADSDGVAAARRRPVLVPHRDSNAQRIPSIGPESAEEADRPPVSSLSVVFAYLMEGFVLYGASLHPNGFPVDLPRMEDIVRRPADELSPPRERRAVVPDSSNPTAAQIEQTPGDAEANGIVQRCQHARRIFQGDADLCAHRFLKVCV